MLLASGGDKPTLQQRPVSILSVQHFLQARHFGSGYVALLRRLIVPWFIDAQTTAVNTLQDYIITETSFPGSKILNFSSEHQACVRLAAAHPKERKFLQSTNFYNY